MVVRQLPSNEGGRRRGAGGDGGDGGSSRYDRGGWNVTAVQVHAGAGGFICRQNTKDIQTQSRRTLPVHESVTEAANLRESRAAAPGNA